MADITKNYFENMPYNVWIYYNTIPEPLFNSLFEIINEPNLRPYVDVFENDDTTAFMKKRRYKARRL